MRARRMRRRMFNVFAFACLAFAIYLITHSKEETVQPNGATDNRVAGVQAISNNN